MTSLPFSSLNKKQLTQVAYLFADEAFGTDASAYLYELDKGGDVKGRTMDKQQTAMPRAQMRPEIKITVSQEANVTEEMIQRSRMNMDALAASVARRIYQRQLEEVTS